MSRDYKSTIFLPKTDFPMRAGLPAREPEILARWGELGLFERQRAKSRGREPFILHDGPPYANGHLHMGHALNKVLKDVINRSQQMLGKDANYVPGWDCHGLPIEWKIEESFRERGQTKESVPILEFRRQCREFASHWIEVQTEEFERLGVIGNFDDPYTTMKFSAEAQILREIGKFLMTGGLYRGSKPVLWSVVEQTALADAEVEYHDHHSATIWVAFPLAKLPAPLQEELAGARVVIWTTTPWTIPGNRAVAYGADMDYLCLEVEACDEKSRCAAGQRYLVAEALSEDFKARAGIQSAKVAWRGKGGDLAGAIARHPLHEEGYDFDVPLLEADFVTLEQGTGFVHIAPGHGADDYDLGMRTGLEVPLTVDGDGSFMDHVPLFAGKVVYDQNGKEGDANDAVMAALNAAGRLLGRRKLVHSYPHSWRSKKPLIFRNTPQWFISMSSNGLRDKALAGIRSTRFVPPAGQARLYDMVASRPDWCVSRQRLWGVPLALFVHKKSGEVLRDQAVIDRIAAAFEEEGGDAWYSRDPQDFLGNDYAAEDYEQVMDVVEVWFDSGSTHSFVLEAREDLRWPASLYLEGSDQHRGWFHTSLLESCGTRGRPPFDAVLTHGFVLDEKGRKMSKSLGNVVSPQDILSKQGADILRLWVVASNYEEDLRIGPEILRYQVDAYRRLRNTLRYLLGNLDGYSEAEALPPGDMPDLDRWVLHRLFEIDRRLRRCCEEFDFHAIYQMLHNFCAVDLSAFYFDVRKDVLYCDSADSTARRACRSVLEQLFSCLTAWLAPILCFTAEEAWWSHGKGADSVHLRLFPEIPADWEAPELAAKIARLREVRRVATGALETARAQKVIGSSLQACPRLGVADRALYEELQRVDLAELFITSDVVLEHGELDGGRNRESGGEAFRLAEVPGVAVEVGLAAGEKCQRCWKVLPEVGEDPEAEGTCRRCAEAVRSRDEAAAGAA
jgi:isoleucyl-tRNA synthetase